MANTHSSLASLFTDIADSIREKTGSTDIIVAHDFPEAISGITTSFEEFMQTIAETSTFTVPVTGRYRITAIGSGSAANYVSDSTTWNTGCCGGGGYIEIDMVKDMIYQATINGYAQFADDAGTVLIKATAATAPTLGGTAGKSGTVSGTNVIAFESNDKTNQQSIIPPECYNNSFYVSRGGYGGYYGEVREDSSGSNTTTRASDGGAGLFGGNGGDGGAAGSNYIVSTGGSEHATFDTPALPAGEGGGAGGNGQATTQSVPYSFTPFAFGGGGGGGGYGGGGGKGMAGGYYYSRQYYIYGNGGKGGAACIFIHRIG